MQDLKICCKVKKLKKFIFKGRSNTLKVNHTNPNMHCLLLESNINRSSGLQGIG
jgi:hypothetical protein